MNLIEVRDVVSQWKVSLLVHDFYWGKVEIRAMPIASKIIFKINEPTTIFAFVIRDLNGRMIITEHMSRHLSLIAGDEFIADLSKAMIENFTSAEVIGDTIIISEAPIRNCLPRKKNWKNDWKRFGF
jgi:hypothetical protein